MNATLDAGVQLIQVVLLVVLVAVNVIVVNRLRNIEEKLNR
jgi:hypothetical protein